MKNILDMGDPLLDLFRRGMDEKFSPGDPMRFFREGHQKYLPAGQQLVDAYQLLHGEAALVEQAFRGVLDYLHQLLPVDEKGSSFRYSIGLEATYQFGAGAIRAISTMYVHLFPQRRLFAQMILRPITTSADWDGYQRAEAIQKRFNYTVMSISTRLDEPLEREDLTALLDYLMSLEKYDTRDEERLDFIAQLAVHNRELLQEVLLDYLSSDDDLEVLRMDNTLDILPPLLAKVVGEEGFSELQARHDDISRVYEDAKGQERETEDIKREVNRLRRYRIYLEKSLEAIGGDQAVSFFSTGKKALWTDEPHEFEWGFELPRLLASEVKKGHLEVLESTRDEILRPLFERYVRVKEIEALEPPENPRESKSRLAAYQLKEFFQIVVDAGFFKEFYSEDLERDIFGQYKFSAQFFIGISDPEVRQYYISELLTMLEYVRTLTAKKSIFYALSYLRGEDPERERSGWWMSGSDEWMDYQRYARTLRVLGDYLAENASETDDRDVREKWHKEALNQHRRSMDNFSDDEIQKITHTVRENDTYRRFLVREANQGNVTALRLLILHPPLARRLFRAGILEVSEEQCASAILKNNFNRIVVVQADQVKAFEPFITGGRLSSLQKKLHDIEHWTFQPLLLDEVIDEMRSYGFTRPHVSRIGGTVKKMGCHIQGLDRAIIPRLSILSSGYRGTREDDHSDARFTTRALTTAIAHYGWQGGEFASGRRIEPGTEHEQAKGTTVVHEIDYQVGRPKVSPDRDVSLAVYHHDPIPVNAYKRTVLIGNRPLADIMQDLLKQQVLEDDAKRIIFGVLDEGKLLKAESHELMTHMIGRLEQSLSLLDPETGEAGLRPAYFQHVYGPLQGMLGRATTMSPIEFQAALDQNGSIAVLRNEYSYVFR